MIIVHLSIENPGCSVVEKEEDAITAMKPDKKTLVVPVLLITVGAAWLLTTLQVMPDIDWVWTLALAVLGLLTLAISGLDKMSVVLGPFLLLASGLSILRQTGQLRLSVEAPILVIIAGILLLTARLPVIPMPDWLLEDSESAHSRSCR